MADRQNSRARLIFLVFPVIFGLSVVALQPPALADGGCSGRHCPGEGSEGPQEPEGGEGRFSGTVLFSNDGDVYEPSSGGGGGACDGCLWVTRPVCELGGQYTCRESARCDAAGPGPEDGVLTTLMFLRPGSAWENVGTFCDGEGEELHDTADIGEQVADQWVRYLPPLNPSSQPSADRTLVNWRTLFHSGHESSSFGPKDIAVYDFTIRLTAKTRYRWTFEPGVTETFDSTGSTYPDLTVGHEYTEPGTYTATVQTEWIGEFSVDGRGPWQIETPATQQAALDVEVVDAEPVLVR